MLNLRRRLLPLFIIPLALFATGTVGYMLIEGWSPVESFYMTAITLTTVGFAEVRPLSNLGRLFTVGLILLGVGTVAYGFSTLGELLLTSGFGERLQKRRVVNMISKLEKHTIVCGYGRVGQNAIHTLRQSGRDVVIIEKQPEVVQDLRQEIETVIEGDATNDEVLQEAGIERASAIVVCTGDDSDNLFVVLSARALNEKLFIIARSDADNESKMQRAGANRVVSPYKIGGRHMANIVIRPHVTDFFDVVTLDGGLELWLEELVIQPTSALVGKTVGEANVRRTTGVMMVAVLRHKMGITLKPDADTLLEAEDELIVLGTREQLAKLEKLTSGRIGHH